MVLTGDDDAHHGESQDGVDDEDDEYHKGIVPDPGG